VRVPFVGAAFIGQGMTSFNRWSTLRAGGEVR
jgi:hypothetical protein